MLFRLLAHNEACCLARLDKTAAALQSAVMKLRSMSLADAALRDDAALVGDLGRELDALGAIQEELRALDQDTLGLRQFDFAASIHLPTVSRNAR